MDTDASMRKRLNYFWRLFATGLSFSIFGIGGLFLMIIFSPVCLVIRDTSLKTMTCRRIISRSFRFFIQIMRYLGVLQYTLTGIEQFNRKGMLIVANHPTLLDIVFLIAFIPKTNCVVKSSLWKNPFMLGPLYAAGYIKNSNSSSLLEECIESLRSGQNVIIFPEGTRTPPDGIIKIKRGAANLAVRGRINILPVRISCVPRTLGNDTRWWQIPSEPAYIRIDVQKDIFVEPFIDNAPNEVLAVRRLNRYLQDYLNRGKK